MGRLGADVLQLMAQQRPIAPYVSAHLCYVFTVYVMYEASNQVMLWWVYNKAVPEGLPMHVYFAIFGCVCLR